MVIKRMKKRRLSFKNQINIIIFHVPVLNGFRKVKSRLDYNHHFRLQLAKGLCPDTQKLNVSLTI